MWKWGSCKRVVGAAARLGAAGQSRRKFLGRAADGISYRARAVREDHGQTDEEGGGGDGGRGLVSKHIKAVGSASSAP